MWLIFFGLGLLLFIASVVYMTLQVSRFGPVNKIVKQNKRIGLFISFVIIAIVFVVISLAMSIINAMVVFLNIVMFFLLFGLAGKIIDKVSGKKAKGNFLGALALITSLIYLCVSFYLCNNVWEKDYTLHTDKELGNLKVAMFADSHIGTTFDGDGFAVELGKIVEQKPDILFIVGDMVDDSSKRADFERACEALSEVDIKYGVWYVFGNHDEGYGQSRDFNGQDIREILTKNGINILEDEVSLVDDRFYVVGRKDRSHSPAKRMEELLSGIDTDKYIIVLDHIPNDYDNEAKSAVDLVLSGHTHGGQMIPITFLGEGLGINDSTYGHKAINGTDFIVTSGISDWEIDFKSGVKSEYVIIDIDCKYRDYSLYSNALFMCTYISSE